MMDRRAYPRVEVSHPVLYISDTYPRPKAASTIDLSLGGTRIETTYPLMSGEGLDISVALHPQVIKCKGKVVHTVQETNDKLEAGVQFEALSPHDRLYLKQYLFHVMEKRAIESLSQE
jgi:c-di-GMP-binding flagellar brake protein YcgR